MSRSFQVAGNKDIKIRKIAVIDEDEKFLGEIEKVLISSGYVPFVVKDVLSAVDVTARSRPDVILLELRMSIRNGFELAHEMNLLFETQRTPIIAMSSFLKERPFPLMNLCGIKRYLQKPFHPLDVISAIEDVVGEK